MDAGRANEHEPNLNLLDFRQPKHLFWPSDLSYIGPNEPEVGLVNFFDGLKSILLLKNDGLFTEMMNFLRTNGLISEHMGFIKD